MSDLKHCLGQFEHEHRPTICSVCGLDLRGSIAVTVRAGGLSDDERRTPCRGCGYPLTIAVDLFTPLDVDEVGAVCGKASR